MKNADKPAMPNHYAEITNCMGGSDELYCDEQGLTKREMFAMHAMVGIMQDVNFCQSHCENDVAKLAVLQADALLYELEKSDEK